MNKCKQLGQWLPGIAACLVCSYLIFPVFFLDVPWPTNLRDAYESRTFSETGALNIVSAIYLGYRAYDTLGEAIVLFISVMGTLYVIRHSPASILSIGRPHTSIMRFITGKIGPIILVFGLYVMTFGYESPGGGFQGGAVLASGIIFLAFGHIENKISALARMRALHRIESVAFVLLVAAFFSGIISGAGFLANPFKHASIQPVVFITVLNIIIGIKVGASIGLLAIAMFAGDIHE